MVMRNIAIMAMVLASLAQACSIDEDAEKEKTAGLQVASVSAEEVKRGDVQESVETFGNVEFDPHEIRTLSFLRKGRVASVMVEQGQRVSHGEVLVRLGPLPSSNPEVARARIEIEYAKQELTRVKRLRHEQLATNQALQLAEKNLATSKAVLAALGAGKKSGSQVIRSPFEGVVVKVLVTAGSIVDSAQAALQLVPDGALVVRAGFEPEDEGKLVPGQTTLIRPLFSAGNTPAAKTKLSPLHRVIDGQTQLIEAIIRPAPIPPWMLAGQRVGVKVLVHRAHDVLRLPFDAVLKIDGSTGVFVVDSGLARWKKVELGIKGERWLEVTGGIESGDLVVTTGRTSLEDGMGLAVSQPSQ